MSATKEIADAQKILAAAEDVGAPRSAVYEYTAAAEYLHKAREENGYSDFEAARVYAARAAELAQQALKRANRNSTVDGSLEQTLPDGPITRTTKEKRDPTPPPAKAQKPARTP